MFDIFHFFKEKKIPAAFAPLRTDMHCHLLPQVDDGSKSLEESLEMLETMKEVGFEEVRLTPHYQIPRFPNTEEDILRRFNNFCAEVDANKGDKDLPVMKGVSGEYRIDSGFRGRIENKEEMLTFRFADEKKGSEKGLLLVELSLHQPYMGVEQVMFDLQMAGYDVVLAHPERYPYYDSHSSELEQLKEQGIYFQANILSLDGFYSESARKKAFDYIENGWIEFLGTDLHNPMYAKALQHAACNKKIIQLIEKEEFENKNLVKE